MISITLRHLDHTAGAFEVLAGDALLGVYTEFYAKDRELWQGVIETPGTGRSFETTGIDQTQVRNTCVMALLSILEEQAAARCADIQTGLALTIGARS